MRFHTAFFSTTPCANRTTAIKDIAFYASHTITYNRDLKHAALGPYVFLEGLLCGPRCCLGIFKQLTFTLPSSMKNYATKYFNQS